MAEVFIIADTHFGHEKCCTTFTKPDGVTPLRPFSNAEEMDEILVQRWNEVVKPEDKVYHLGDVVINKKHLPTVARLNGKKRLVMGNHESGRGTGSSVLMQYFESLYGCRVFHDLIMTHIPIHETQLRRFGVNVHGHLHAHDLDDPRYLCVSVEHTDFRPLTLGEVRERIKAKQELYGYESFDKPWGNGAGPTAS